MQKIKTNIIIIIFFSVISIFNTSMATEEEILQSQSETLDISGFIEEADKYTKKVFSDIDTSSLLNNAIKGDIDNKTIISKILNLFGKEIKSTIKIIR